MTSAPIRKARYDYTCRRCNGSIPKGTMYADFSGEVRCPVHESCVVGFMNFYVERTVVTATREYTILVPVEVPPSIVFQGYPYILLNDTYVRDRPYHVKLLSKHKQTGEAI